MSHDLSLAQKHAWNLARILMTLVVLFQSGTEFGVLPVDEFEDVDVIGLYLYDPYSGGEARPSRYPGKQCWRRSGWFSLCQAGLGAVGAIVSVNLEGVAFGTQCALAHMLPRGYGRIINTASQLAHKPAPGNAAYCAAKAGVGCARGGGARVAVNCVCPVPTDTPIWRASDPKWDEWKLSTLLIKRIGTPEEIAWAYVYLASDEAVYVLGQSISPNGGDVMW